MDGTVKTGVDSTERNSVYPMDIQDPPTRRITVYFDGPAADNALVLEYAATNSEAWEFTSAAVHAGLTVTVDSKIRPDLRRLPCHSLWR